MKCRIRKWQLSDCGELAAVLSNKKILENLRDGIPYPYTENDGKEYILSMLKADENEAYAFAIVFEETVIGSIAAFRQQNIHRRTAELGYYIDEKYWGRGIMTQAVKQICHYIFENTDIVRIYAQPFSRNAASCRVLEKSGFKCEGIMQQNAEKNGVLIDMKLYAKVK